MLFTRGELLCIPRACHQDTEWTQDSLVDQHIAGLREGSRSEEGGEVREREQCKSDGWMENRQVLRTNDVDSNLTTHTLLRQTSLMDPYDTADGYVVRARSMTASSMHNVYFA